MHDPAEQLVNTQLDPCAHASAQLPAEQSTLHVAPGGQDVLQWPLEHWMLHIPLPQ
jgi:hypothetical protein